MRKKQPKKFRGSLVVPVDPIQRAILNTLKYRMIFGCPMNLFQIWNYYISDKSISPSDFLTALHQLTQKGQIVSREGFYSAGTTEQKRVKKRYQHSQQLILHAERISKFLNKLPWVEMIAVTGSVAAFNADTDSDVDILIVSKSKRLWLTRLFVVSILKALGTYWNVNKPAGRICPNILMTREDMAWNKEKRNIYSANEVSLVFPIFVRHNCYLDFLNANDWIQNFLPNFIPSNEKTIIDRFKRSRGLLKTVVDLVELAVMKIQLIYMVKRKTTEIVSQNFMHFNKNDVSREILKKYAS